MYVALPSWLLLALAFLAGIFAGPRLRQLGALARPAGGDDR